MAIKKTDKKELMSLRVDPEFRFVLDFIARINGQSNTKVIYDAVYNFSETLNKNWKNYWDIDDGVRFIKMAINNDLTLSYEENEKINFIKSYKIYFFHFNYMKKEFLDIDREKVNVLWLHIDTLVENWKNTKDNNPFLVIKEMERILQKAKITTPNEMRSKIEKNKGICYIKRILTNFDLNEEEIRRRAIVKKYHPYFLDQYIDQGPYFNEIQSTEININYENVIALWPHINEIEDLWSKANLVSGIPADMDQSGFENPINYMEKILKSHGIITPKEKNN